MRSPTIVKEVHLFGGKPDFPLEIPFQCRMKLFFPLGFQFCCLSHFLYYSLPPFLLSILYVRL